MTTPANSPGFALRCSQCDLRPNSGAELGMVAAHWDAEHAAEHGPQVQMTLVVVCLVDDSEMQQGWRDTLYICPACGARRNVKASR